MELRKLVESQQASPTAVGPSVKASLSSSASPTISQLPSHRDQYMGSEEAVAAMMELRAGHDGGYAQLRLTRQLGNVMLTQERIQDLFQM